MRSIALSLGMCALAACASDKSAERPDESAKEAASYEARVERVRKEGDYLIESPREREERAERGHETGAKGEKREKREKQGKRDGDHAKDEAKEERKEPVAADNTRTNERDEQPNALIPTDQGETESDLETTQKIRKAVMDDDSLSFTAKNIKIITQDGKVTLRGPVKSEQERSTIGAAAKRVASGRVDNQLEVAD